MASNLSAGADPEAKVEIQLTVIDDAVQSHFATFFNVNQRVVATGDGIFVVYLKDTHDIESQPPSRNHWVLCRSVDDGRSFRQVFSLQANGDTTIVGKAPEIIADDSGNLFLVTCMNDQHVHVWRFNRDHWDTPVYHQKNRIGGFAPKFSVRLDAESQKLLVMTAAYFLSIDLETGLAAKSEKYQLLDEGEFAGPQYSFLDLTPDGELFAAWHTARKETSYYYDIHFAVSRRAEAYRIWRSPLNQRILGGASGSIVCDNSGPAPMVNYSTELSLDGTQTNGLNHMLYKGHALHFIHGGRCAADSYVQSRYTRISTSAPSEIHRITEPDWGGRTLQLDSSDGFFCTQDTREDTPLYVVSHRGQQLFAIRSVDNGNTWTDYAVSNTTSPGNNLYSVTGNFRLQNDHIIGVYTEVHPQTPHRLIFFRIPTVPQL
ncbi:MAG: hypothetical protein R3C17_01305 [Planctomycetaceae bacterium]